MDDAIRESYGSDYVKKLIGKDKYDRLDDDPQVWSESSPPVRIDPGFFLFGTADFEGGTIATDYIDVSGDFFESLFPNQDLFSTAFEKPEYEAELFGIGFDKSQIELLLPTIQLTETSEVQPDLLAPKRSLGRPPRWDWESALAHITSVAQHPDGLPTGPGAQARVEEEMAQWFMDEVGETPAESQIRQRASKIMRMIARSKRA